MKFLRIVAAFALCALAAAALYAWHIQHGFSSRILRHRCDMMPCVVTMGSLFPGDWDQVAVFEYNAKQEEITATVGAGVEKPDLQRLIVFLKGKQVVRTISESGNVERPAPSIVYFSRKPEEQNHIVIQRNDAFVIIKGWESCEDCTALDYIRPGEVVE